MNAARQAEFDFTPTPESEAYEAQEEAPQARCCTASAAMLERIKKLLRLAADKRGHAAESERAAELAFELAEKHHVDLASLSLEDQVEQLIADRVKCGQRLDRVTDGALRIVRAYFHVEVCLSGVEAIFVGRETDVAVASYIYEFLRRAARDCLRRYEDAEKTARRRMTTGKRMGYTAGFFYGVGSKLLGSREAMQLTDSTRALVLVEKAKREEKMDEIVPDRVTRPKLRDTHKNETALGKGYRAGRETQLHTPVCGTKPKPLALTA